MSKGTVLIVEDENDLREIYTFILAREGYEIWEAKNGAEGLLVMAEREPDLILLDIFMPVLDGKGFLEKLDMSKYPTTKVIVCSNTADQNLRDEMIKLGAEQVVTKSTLEPSDLAKLVASYMVQIDL
jgi:CheY-like chemotaxis protein